MTGTDSLFSSLKRGSRIALYWAFFLLQTSATAAVFAVWAPSMWQIAGSCAFAGLALLFATCAVEVLPDAGDNRER